MNNLENNQEKNFIETIGDSFKLLMDKITSGLNSILVKLGLKKEEEIELTMGLTGIELNNLYTDVKKTIEDKENTLNNSMKTWIEKIPKFKEHYVLLKEEFGENIADIEMINHIKTTLRGRLEDAVLNEEEQKEIEKELFNQKKSLNDGGGGLNEIIKEILKENPNYTIKEIIESYEELKLDNSQTPTKEEVVNKLSGND